MTDEILRRLKALADPERAAGTRRFFKTGAGEYGEGDVFLGITMPELHLLAARHTDTTAPDLQALLRHEWHEARMLALLVLVLQYKKGSEAERSRIVELYLENAKYVNNWDLVDSSAYQILGDHLRTGDRSILAKLAASGHLWSERIAIVSTLAFIREGDTADTYHLAERFFTHSHDLMHKATGWMLREAGKKDPSGLRRFLSLHTASMPRTMLRYAIERFPEPERTKYLLKKASRK